MRGRFALLFAVIVTAIAAGHVVADDPQEPAAFPEPLVMRVESDLFAAGEKPVARTLTLFHEGVAWDFLEMPARPTAGKNAKADAMTLVEIVLHDPARERVVVIDPVRRVKTEISTVQLERLGSSLAKWARESDDRLICWAGGPDFTDGFRVEDDTIELTGPRARYAVKHVAASSPDQAESYRRFADTAILLKALMQPGGMPPFPRLAINRQLENANAIPTEVTLEVDPRGVSFGGPTKLRGVHKSHPRLLSQDLDRIKEAQAAMGRADQVDLAEYARGPHAPMPR
jgi:hypothetical protein